METMNGHLKRRVRKFKVLNKIKDIQYTSLVKIIQTDFFH